MQNDDSNNPFDDKNKQKRSSATSQTSTGLSLAQTSGVGSPEQPPFRHAAVASGAQSQPFPFVAPTLQMPGATPFLGPLNTLSAPGWPAAGFTSNSQQFPPMQLPLGGFAESQWGGTGPIIPNFNANPMKTGNQWGLRDPDPFKKPSSASVPARTLTSPVHQSYGWNLERLIFEEVDLCVPEELMKLKINPEDVDNALSNMQNCFKRLSFQAEFENNPVGVRLRTLENIELYIFFFQDDRRKVLVDIQRRQGDYLDANKYIQQILAAATGTIAEEPVSRAPSAEKIREFESFLDRCTSGPCVSAPADAEESPSVSPAAADENMKDALGSIRASVTSPYMDQRRLGLDNLLIISDLEKTLSQMAIAGALVAVTGKSPAHEPLKWCKDIQEVLARLIVKQEFAGDDTNMYAEMDSDIVGFLASDYVKKEGRSRYYDRYIGEVFLIALKIVSNSLQVLQVFGSDNTLMLDIKAAVSDLNEACLAIGSCGIVETMMEVIGQPEHRLPEKYFACKTLRLVLEGNSDLCLAFRENATYASSIEAAILAGSVHHKLLSEAQKLQRFL